MMQVSKSPFPTTSIAALVFLCGLLSAGCGKQAPPAFERPPAPVSATTSVAKDVPVYLDEIGKCVAREVVSVEPQVSGRITAIHFQDGADVKKDDALFTIDPRPYQARLDAAEADLARAKAVLGLAKIDFARVAALVEAQAMSASESDAKRNAVEVAEAELKQAEAAIETARLNLEYCHVRSPMDGRAGQRLVDLGNVVPANGGSLLNIQRLDPIYAEFNITENDLTAVQQNMALGTLRVEVRLPDPGDEPRVGQLSFVDNAVQAGTGTIKLRATLANRDHHFWPGRFVNVRLVLSTLAAAVLVPASSSQTSATGPYVYVIKEDATAELRPVTLGQRQGELVVVREGLKAGERVIVNGQLAVTPGGKVRVEETPPTPGGPTPQAGNKS